MIKNAVNGKDHCHQLDEHHQVTESQIQGVGFDVIIFSKLPGVHKLGLVVGLQPGLNTQFFCIIVATLHAGVQCFLTGVVVEIVLVVGMMTAELVFLQGAVLGLFDLFTVVVNEAGHPLRGIHMTLVNTGPTFEQLCHDAAEH